MSALHRLSLKHLFLALALAGSGAQAAEAQAQVVLPLQAQVRNGPVLLSDVAIITGYDSALIQRLSDIPLGKSPRAGESTNLERESVERWVRRQLGDAADAVQWGGADEMRLTTRRAAEPSRSPAAGSRGAAPAVARGEWATLRARSGPIELERRVEVLEDGAVGQAVRVRSAGASETLAAKVVAAGRLELEP